MGIVSRRLLRLGEHGLGGHCWTNWSPAWRRAIALVSIFLAAVVGASFLLASVRRNHLRTIRVDCQDSEVCHQSNMFQMRDDANVTV